jgi:rod shape-determining protein MreD
MGNFLSLPLLAVAAALQATLVPQIRLLGGGPDLVFLVVLAWAINADLQQAILWAFVGGICQDLLSAAPLGTSVLGLLVLIFGISGLGRQFTSIGFLLIIGAVLFGTLANHVVTLLALAVSGYAVDWALSLSYITAPTILYNLLVIWPVYGVIRLIQRRVAAGRGAVRSAVR